MMRHISKCMAQIPNKRLFSTTPNLLHRVTVIGSFGGLGKALSLLLKANPLVTDLVLMDIENTAGIAADLSHIDTFSGVASHSGIENMEKSLECSNLVVLAAGVPRAKKTTVEALFDANKEIVYNVTSLKAKICPEAFLAIITNPINALIPLAAETLKQANAYDSKKLFGISKSDTMAARTLIGNYLIIDPVKVNVNVVGGHSENTMVPVLSSATPSMEKNDPDEVAELYERIRTASNAVPKATEGKRTAQLSIAYAASTFCNSVLQAMEGKSGISDVAFVESKAMPEVSYFSSIFDINKEGIKGFHPLPEMSKKEKDMLEKAIPELKESMQIGIKYAQSQKGQK